MYNYLIRKIKLLSDWQISLFLFVAALILRVSYSVFSYIYYPLPSHNLYYELARQITSQKAVFYDTNHSYYEIVGPVLPWINALTMTVFGENYLGLYLITSLASAFITFFTYKTARFVVDKTTALIAGIWSALYFFYLYFSPSPGKDIWMALFMIILIYMFLVIFKRNHFSYPKYILFIVLFVTSFHLDERFLIFLPFIFIYILIYETSSFSKFRIKKSLLFAGLVILLMIPWSIRNYIKYGGIMLISARTQIVTDKIMKDQPDNFEEDSFMDLYGRYYIHDNQIDSVLKGTKKVTDGGYVISDKQRTAMLEGNLPHPLGRWEAIWIRTKDFLRPFQIRGEYQKTGYFYYEKSLRQNAVSFIFFGIVFFFSIPGFFYLYKKDKYSFSLFTIIIVIYTLIHSFIVPWSTWRYRLPLDSVFIIAGTYGMTEIFKRIKYKNSSGENHLTINTTYKSD